MKTEVAIGLLLLDKAGPRLQATAESSDAVQGDVIA